jgi:hypothetical protein
MRKIIACLIVLLMVAMGFGSVNVAAEVPCPEWEDVEYLGDDWDTQGNWVGVYGHYAYILPKAPRAGWEYPIGTPGSQQPTAPYYDYVGGDGWPVDYTLTGPVFTATPDVRALEKPDESARRATCYWYNYGLTQSVTLTVPSGDYQLGLYLLDWDSYVRAETVTVTDGTGTVSTSVSGFHGGVYQLYKVSGGTVTISLKATGGANSVISGIFLDSTTGTGTISHLGSDTTTKGDWVGNYGSQWYLLCAMDSIYTKSNTQPEDPAYDISGGTLSVTYTVTNGNYWAWTKYLSSGDVIKPTYAYNWQDISYDIRAAWFTQDHVFDGYPSMADMVHREATCWDSHTDSYFLATLSIPEGHFYLSLYALDFDTYVREETIEIYDDEGNLLASTYVTDFHDGVYERFGIAGPIDITIKVIKNAGANSVLSGIFLDKVPCQPAPQICSISGYKFFDANTDGIYNDYDWPLEGWEIQLYDEFGFYLASTYTNAEGFYIFENLEEGIYYINEVMQPGWTAITPTYYMVDLDCGGGGGGTGGGGAPPSGDEVLKGTVSVDLYAGQYIHVGTIDISYDPDTDTLTVTYNLFEGYWLEETQLYVGSTTPGSNPGSYPYKDEFDYPYPTTWTYEITILDPKEMLYIAAHAVIGSADWTETETAWVNEEADPPGWVPFGQGWGGYFPYIPCCKVPALTGFNFGNWAPIVTGPGGLTIGFWKTNIGKNLKEIKGKAKVPGDKIQTYLDGIPNEFFTDLTLEEAYEMLNIPNSADMDDKARAHILALLLTIRYYGEEHGNTIVYLPDISTWDDPYLPFYGPLSDAVELIKKYHHKGYMTNDEDFMKLAKNLADALNNLEEGTYVWVEPL